MYSYIIEGGNKLNGEIYNAGSKNAALPILATSILNPNEVTFYNVPDIEDIDTTVKILRFLGCKIHRKCDKITISSVGIKRTDIPEELMNKCRSTVILAGALIGRFKKAKFSFPGGCNIGARPINLHIKALKELGVSFTEKQNNISCLSKKIEGRNIELDFPSVGATENIILASVYAKGATQILNPAKEPEIIDLANCLNKMGARIFGAGTSKITIVGVKKLKTADYRIMPDRIEAGTYLCGALITKGSIKIKNADPASLSNVLFTLKKMGGKITIKGDTIFLKSQKKINPINLSTEPHPRISNRLRTNIYICINKSKRKIYYQRKYI